MTVQSTTTRADYTGNGATTTFTVPFYFLDTTHLTVLSTTALGVTTTLVLNSDYTVTGAGVSSGGSIICTTAPLSGTKISILRNVPFTQTTHYVEGDPFPAASHEQALDKLTMEVQQTSETLSRALTLSAATTSVSAALPNPSATKLIGWNAAANALQNYDPTALATSIVYGTGAYNLFSGDGTTTTFTLSTSPGSLANLDVSINGVDQRPGIDYTWSGGTSIVFTTAPISGSSNISVKYKIALTQGSWLASDGLFQAAGANAVMRTVQSKERDIVSLGDYGGVGDGVTANTSAAGNASVASSGYDTFVPAGVYVDGYAHGSLPGRWWGPGYTKGADGRKRGRWFSNFTGLASRANTSDETLWYNGDWSFCSLPIEHVINLPLTTTGTLTTSASTASGGTVLTFATVPSWVAFGIGSGYSLGVRGTGIPAGTTVSAVTSTTVTLSAATTATISSGASITFGIGDYIQPYEASPVNVSLFAKQGSLGSNMDPTTGAGGQVVHAFNANVKNDAGGGGMGAFCGLVNIARPFSGFNTTYPYNTAAGWLMTGKVMANCTNPYITGIEFELNDNGYGSTAIGLVIDFARSGTPVGNHHYWSGIEFNFGASSVAPTRWIGGSGSCAMGIDFTRVTLTNSSKPAVIMLPDQRVMFAATAGTYSPSSLGTSSIYYSSSATKVIIESTGAQFQFGSLGELYIPSSTGVIYINGTQVVKARQTGYTAMTGTSDTSTAYATSTVTLAQLAGRVMALQAALTTHGLIGA